MIVLDTTVLFYAVTGGGELADPSRRLVTAIESGGLEATTTLEVIQEFAHVYARRRDRRDAARLARHYAALLAPLLRPDEQHLDTGLRLFERHPQLGAFDAVLAAVTIAHDAEALVSADSDFRAVPNLRLVEPGTQQFERLLAR